MTSSHNSFDAFSSDITRHWIDRELKASHEELSQLNLLMKDPDIDHETPLGLRTVLFIQMAKLTEKVIQISQGNYSSDPELELEEINRELKETYQVDDIDAYEKKAINPAFPRVKFLLEKRRYLMALQNSFKMVIPEETTAESEHKERKGALKVIFDIGKKFIDLIDDVWAAMRNVLSHQVIETVGPILVGSTGFLIHLGEGYEGAKLAYQAYKDEKIGQRKTRILTSALTFAIAGAGVGMGLALLASAGGASVAAAPLLPVLIPAALTAIYALSLWRQSYIFHRAKEEEQKAYNAYQTALTEIQPEIEKLKERMSQLTARKGKISEKDFLLEQTKIDQDCAVLQGSIESLRRIYDDCREKRLQAERDVAFTTVEVAASAMVLIGIILGTAAIVGASVGTFGIAPLALIITGVVTGAGSKIFEARDEKNHHAYTSAIRNFFVNLWEKVVSSEKTLEVAETPAPIPAPIATSTKKNDLPTVRPSSILSEEVRLRPPSATTTKVSVTAFSSVASPLKTIKEGHSPLVSSNETIDSSQKQKNHPG